MPMGAVALLCGAAQGPVLGASLRLGSAGPVPRNTPACLNPAAEQLGARSEHPAVSAAPHPGWAAGQPLPFSSSLPRQLPAAPASPGSRHEVMPGKTELIPLSRSNKQ